jgi:uncharacterized SAM-binding protein YcdF (DUF218 family)
MKKIILATSAALMLTMMLVASSPTASSVSFIDPTPNPCVNGKITGNWGKVYNFGTPSVYIVWESNLSAYTLTELNTEWAARNTPIPYAWSWRTVCNSVVGGPNP